MSEPIEIEIVYAEPQRYWCQTLRLPAGSRVQDALARLDPAAFPDGLAWDAERLAVYGRKVKPTEPLHAFDRIELLRPLTRDPKDTRRLRAAANPLKRPLPRP
jgi:putative ubiquitin-RnfH superfamily antitoxin RatB of RatAB toxin-antitoxin module